MQTAKSTIFESCWFEDFMWKNLEKVLVFSAWCLRYRILKLQKRPFKNVSNRILVCANGQSIIFESCWFEDFMWRNHENVIIFSGWCLRYRILKLQKQPFKNVSNRILVCANGQNHDFRILLIWRFNVEKS